MSDSGATVVRLPSKHRAREEASVWLARLDRGLSATERRDLDSWLDEDPINSDALLELAAFWDQTAVLSELAELFPLSRPKRARSYVGAWTAAGAAVAMAVVAAVFYVGMFDERPAPDSRQVYQTAVGGQSTVELLDGSVVTLNTNSSIEVNYTSTGRTVVLNRGEGYFAVEPDSDRPFRVHAGARVFEAVGTAFNVRLGRDNDVKMMVTEGKVGVFPSRAADSEQRGSNATPAEAIVAAGSLAIVGEGGLSIQALPAAQIEAQLSWQQGMLVFDGEPLEAVLLEMSRYTLADIVVDESVRDVRVGGYFRAGDVDGLLIALRENFEIESTRTGSGRIILSAPSR